ncbi:MAG: undecaprenyl-phosphate glucose phosphotransferase [Hyphomicrobium sp.]|nr:undecaprenyl-phosphate glucose phosphotransferase [Hyphomicrobium sp.]
MSEAPSLAVPSQQPVEAPLHKPQKLRLSRTVAMDILGLADAVGVMAGFLLPAFIYSQAGGITSDWSLLFKGALAAALVMHVTLRLAGMYDLDKMNELPHRPALTLFAVFMGVSLVMGLGAPHAIRDEHLWVWYFVGLSSIYTCLLINRGVANPLFAYLTARGYFDVRVAVFGAGTIARRVREHLGAKNSGIYFAGVYDDRKDETRLDTDGLDVVGRLDDLVKSAREGGIDKIIIALPQTADRRMAYVARRLEKLPVSVHIVTHIASDLVDDGPAHRVSSIGSVGLLDVKSKPLNDWAPMMKRAEDLIVGGILMLAALPLFPLIALAIKVDSRGPVLFRQTRAGLNQRPIEVLKFRTMRTSDDPDVSQAQPGDERVTFVGRFLRRTSLDELPQLWNVLKGDMSLVGPRPHAVAHDIAFGRMVESYDYRHQVKPGLTGLAQVTGLRGPTPTADSVEARVNADIAYIRNWSLWLDLKIILQTVATVIRGENAH